MKAYKIELLVIDHDGLKGDGIASVLQNTRFANDCINPHVMATDVADIGEWTDAHPLNRTSTADAEYRRLFPAPAPPAAPVLPAESEWQMPPIDDELRAIINVPLVQSLLYDINLLPEQIRMPHHWGYMLAVCGHMKAALASATPQPELSREGWVWVPRTATGPMQAAMVAAILHNSPGEYWEDCASRVWEAALAAAHSTTPSAAPAQGGGK